MIDLINNNLYNYKQNKENLKHLQGIFTNKQIEKNTNIKNNNEIDKDSKLYNACVDFEAIFIRQMLKVMKKTINKTGLIDGGMAEDIFDDMLYDKYAQMMAKHANFGLADNIYRQLEKNA